MRILKLEGGETILNCGISTLTKYICYVEREVLGDPGHSWVLQLSVSSCNKCAF